ncbi:MAG: fibronectin type III domain-containing protein [Acidobacteria bacterium]|nr:fibronectin type III domain-containing protein [Acidobacteriota bacterium]
MKTRGQTFRFLTGAVFVLLSFAGLFGQVTPINSMSKIFFADVNGDDLLDLIHGNYEKLEVFFNKGTASAPSYTTVDRAITISPTLDRISGTFADIHFNGKMDIFYGTERGAVGWITNTGTAASPTWTNVVYQGTSSSTFLGIWRDPYINMVSFIDLDGDGDLDFVVNDADSQLWYYMNQDRETDGWVDGKSNGGEVTFTALGYYARPLTSCGGASGRHSWTDWTGDGKFDLLSGDNLADALRCYTNTGSPSAPSFSSGTVLNGVITGTYFSTYTEDFTGDGFLDLYYANYQGTFTMLGAANRSGSDVDTLAPSLAADGLTKHAVQSTSITLKWPRVYDAAPAGGSLYRSGVKYYALYRSTEGPDFTPGPGNLLWKHYQFPHWCDYTPEFAAGDKFKVESNQFYYYDASVTPGQTYCYKLQAADYAGNAVTTSAVSQTFDAPYFDSVQVQVSPANTPNATTLTVTTLDQYGSPFPITDNGAPNVILKVYQGEPPAEAPYTLIDPSTLADLTNQTFTAQSTFTNAATIATEPCIAFKVHASATHWVDPSTSVNKTALSATVTIDRAAPPRPATLSVIASTYTSIQLGWSTATDTCQAVASYKLYAKGPGQSSYSVIYTGTALSYVYPVSPCQSYKFYVTAVDTAGNESSVPDPEAVALTASPQNDTTPPSTPGYFQAYYINNENQVLMTWDPASDSGSGIDKYEIHKKTNPSGFFNFLVFQGSSSSGYTDTQSYPGNAIWYRIRAIDKCGNVSDWLEVEVNTATDSTPPTVPTGLNGTPTTTTVSLTWNPSTDSGSGLRAYRVYRNGSGSYLAETAATNYVNSGLSPNTLYNYQVSAIDYAGNESAKCASVPVTTLPSGPTKPNPPTNLNSSDVQPTSLTLNWTASVPNGVTIANYRVYSHASLDSPDGSGTLVATVSGSTTSTAMMGLTSGLTYYYTVKAVSSGAVESDPSNRLPVTPTDVLTPSVPGNFRVTAIGSSTVGLAWDASTPSSGVTYTVCIGKSLFGSYYCYELVTTTTSLSCTATGLQSNKLYEFIIKAVGPTMLESAYSAPLQATTLSPDSEAPTVPGNLQGISPDTTTVNLSWSASTDNVGGSGLDGYKVYRNSVCITKVSTTNYSDTGLQEGTQYNYGVSAVDLAGNESTKATVSVTTLSPDTTAPSVPGNLQGVPVDTTHISLSWTASTDNAGGSGVDGYKIYRDGVYLTKVLVTNFIDSGLLEDSLYSYTVSAIDFAGNESAQTTALPVRTASSKRSLYGAHIVNLTDWYSRVTLANVGTLDNPIDLYAYNSNGAELQKVTVPSLAAKAVYDADVSAIFNASVFAPGNDVWLKVASASKLKGVVTFGTKDNQAVTTIPMFETGASDLIFPYVYMSDLFLTGLTLINTGTYPATVTLMAYSESGVLLSTVQIEITPGNKYVRLVNQVFPAVSDPNQIRFVKLASTQPLIGFELFGSMVSKGWAGLPAFSPSVRLFKTQTPPEEGEGEGEPTPEGIPATPTGFSAAAISATQVYLSWNPNTEPDFHHYEVLSNNTPIPSLIATTTVNNYTVSGLLPETTYRYSLKAVNATGDKSSSTATVPVTTLATGQTDFPFKVYYNEIPDTATYFTGITFSNIGSSPTNVHLDLFDKNGVKLGEKDLSNLAPLSQATYDIRYFFNNQLPAGAAYLKVGAMERILGFELYVTDAGATGVPYMFEGIIGVSLGSTKLDFPLVRDGAEWQSRLRICNPNPSAATVTLKAYGSDGTEKGSVDTVIPAHGKLDQVVNDVYPTTVTDIAWITATSDKSLIGDLFIVAADLSRLISYVALDGSSD